MDRIDDDRTPLLREHLPRWRALLAALLLVATSGGMQAGDSLGFSASVWHVEEGQSGTSTATISVARTGSGVGAVGISYATANGTATAGSDYTAASGTLSWADGDTGTKTFTVTIAGDTDSEWTETIALALSAPTGGAVLGTASSTLRLLSDDGVLDSGLELASTSWVPWDPGATITANPAEIRSGARAIKVTDCDYGGIEQNIAPLLAGKSGQWRFRFWVKRTGTDFTPWTYIGLNLKSGGSVVRSASVLITGAVADWTQYSFDIDTAITHDSALFYVMEAGGLLGSPRRATVLLVDDIEANFAGYLSYTASEFEAVEGTGSGTSAVAVTLQRTGGSLGSVGVRLALTDTSLFGGPTPFLDYLPINAEPTWADGELGAKTSTFPLIADAVVEANEITSVTWGFPTGTIYTQGTNFRLVRILDDDVDPRNALVNHGFENGLTGWSPWGPEATRISDRNLVLSGTGALQITGSAWGGIDQDLTAVLAANPGTWTFKARVRRSGPALGGTLGYFEAALYQGSTQQRIATATFGGLGNFTEVTIVLDTTGVAYTWGGIWFMEEDAANTIIVDRVEAFYHGRLRVNPATAGEGSPLGVTVARIGGSYGTVGVDIATSDGSAVAGSDYTAASQRLWWSDGDTADKIFTVATTADTVPESAETLTATLSGPLGGAIIASGGATATATIVDDDGIGTVRFSSSGFTTTEGNSGTSTATITVQRTGGSNGAVGVSYTSADGSASAGSDYTAASGSLSWSDGDSANKTFTVTIAGDTTVESNETVILTLSSPTGGAALGTAAATLTIANDDAAPVGTIAFSAATYSVTEGNSGTTTATITLRRTGGSAGIVAVDLASANGTATAGSDYTALSTTVVWADGDAADKTVSLSVSGDTAFEANETVSLSLSNAVGGAALGLASATLTITNDDTAQPGTLAFSTATYLTAEGNAGTSTATITVRRTGGSDGAVGVSYATGSGTATAGSDYTTTSGTLSWADGDNADKTFTVTVAGDTTFEADETVPLTLSSPTGGATLGTAAATLTISNDDAAPVGTIAFSAATYSVTEGNSGTTTATITLRRTGGSAGIVAVDLASANGTATAGSDYTALSTTVVWADADAADKTVSLTVSGDTAFEANETIALSLSNAVGGATLGLASATLTIANDDTAQPGTLAFSAATYASAEGNAGTSTATITIRRTGGSDGAVGVSYATGSGTATAGSDYTAASGSLSWADGDSADKTFTVTIAGDTTFEADETVPLTLSSPTGGATLGTAAATLTITNDDAAPAAGSLALTSTTATVSEGAANQVIIGVSRTGGSGGAVGVSIATLAGSALPGSDYTTVSTTLSWADGETGEKTIAIPILDDAVAESSEQFLVLLSTPTGGAVLGSTSVATVTILDADVPASQLASFAYRLEGVVPDGATRVDIDGRAAEIRVLGGVRIWSATVAGSAASATVAFVAPDGSRKARTFILGRTP